MIPLYILIGAFALSAILCFASKSPKTMSLLTIAATVMASFCVIASAYDTSQTSDFVLDRGLFYMDRVSLIFMSLVAFVSVKIGRAHV